ncbi:hypothetical protein Sjap_017313 [Stephania japonica]|uniref:Uncharacterized protein n=1 Tax=Stephania japonica TaxID=461633 RepID=A0AAP0NJA3_9MAGN
MRIALAWDPNNLDFGFTIVGARNDYYDQEHDWEGDYQSLVPVHFEVYSSKSGKSWRASKNASNFLVPFGCHLWHPYVFTGGQKVCWCIGKHMLIFDIEEDNACLIPLPNSHNDINPFCFSSPLSIELRELSYSRMTKDGDLEIWLLRDESNKFEWVNKHTVNLITIIEENWNIVPKICGSNVNVINKKEYAKALVGRRCVQLLLYLGVVEVVWFQIHTVYVHVPFRQRREMALHPNSQNNIALAIDPHNPGFGFTIVAMGQMNHVGQNRAFFTFCRAVGVFTRGKVYWSLEEYVFGYNIEDENVASLIKLPNQYDQRWRHGNKVVESQRK